MKRFNLERKRTPRSPGKTADSLILPIPHPVPKINYKLPTPFKRSSKYVPNTIYRVTFFVFIAVISIAVLCRSAFGFLSFEYWLRLLNKNVSAILILEKYSIRLQ